MINTVLGNWRIERRLGEGGMGDVYLARHSHLGTSAALKILSTSLTRDPKFRERFSEEAKTHAQLVHPHIARVLDFIEQDGLFCQVIEYLSGGTAADAIRNREPLSISLALRWTKQTLSALEYAHEKGIVHRDIKPSNILIDHEGNAKLTDFGIAVVLGERRLTTTGKTIGTPEYMSPEQITAPKDVDNRSDIYSVGIVLFELLTGSTPFQGESDFNVYQSQVRQATPKLRHFNSSVPPKLEQIVSKAMQKKPAHRYHRCAEMLSAIQEFEGHSVPVTRVASRHVLGLGYGRWLALSVALVLVIAFLVTIYVSLRQRPNSLDAANDVEPRAKAKAHNPDSGMAFRERLLATIPVDDGVASILHKDFAPEFGPNGEKVAYVVNDSRRERLVINGARGQPFDHIYGLRFSPDGSKIAYYASQGKRLFVMVDDQSIAVFNTIPSQMSTTSFGFFRETPEFSSDGNRVLHIEPNRAEVRLVAGKWKGPLFDRIWDYQFTADGSTIAYAASEQSKSFVVLGERRGPPYEHIYSLRVSANGSRTAYVATRGGDKIGERRDFVVSDDWLSPECDFVISVSLSRDGGKLLCATQRSNRDYVVLDGAIVGECNRREKQIEHTEWMEAITLEGIKWAGLSTNGNHYAYLVRRDGKSWYVSDGSAGPEFDDVGGAVFSPDGTALAYRGKVGDEWVVVCADKRGPPVDEVSTIQFSEDGTQIGYGARIGGELWWKVLSAR